MCVPTFMLVYFMSNLNDSWYVSGRVHSRCVSSLSLWLLLLPVWVHHLKCSLLPDKHLHQLSKTDGRCIAMWRHMPWIDTHHSVLHTALLVVLVRIYRTCLNLWRLFLWSTPVWTIVQFERFRVLLYQATVLVPVCMKCDDSIRHFIYIFSSRNIGVKDKFSCINWL